MKVEFSTDIKGNSLDFQNGEYRRSFERAKQPFEVTAEEWAILRRTGFFTQVEEAVPQQEAARQQAEQGQQEEGPQRRRARRAQDTNQSTEVRNED